MSRDACARWVGSPRHSSVAWPWASRPAAFVTALAGPGWLAACSAPTPRLGSPRSPRSPHAGGAEPPEKRGGVRASQCIAALHGMAALPTGRPDDGPPRHERAIVVAVVEEEVSLLGMLAMPGPPRHGDTVQPCLARLGPARAARLGPCRLARMARCHGTVASALLGWDRRLRPDPDSGLDGALGGRVAVEVGNRGVAMQPCPAGWPTLPTAGGQVTRV